VRGYTYRFDTSAAVVEVLRGGTAGPVHRTAEPGIHAINIVFHRPLEAGETTSFEYRTLFHYATPPATEFRRACHRPVANVELHVQFDPDLPPEAVWWASWDRLDRPVAYEKLVELGPDGSVHQHVDASRASLGSTGASAIGTPGVRLAADLAVYHFQSPVVSNASVRNCSTGSEWTAACLGHRVEADREPLGVPSRPLFHPVGMWACRPGRRLPLRPDSGRVRSGIAHPHRMYRYRTCW
jgi:hypothetical protein